MENFSQACPSGKWPLKSACPTGKSTSIYRLLSNTTLIKPWTRTYKSGWECMRVCDQTRVTPCAIIFIWLSLKWDCWLFIRLKWLYCMLHVISILHHMPNELHFIVSWCYFGCLIAGQNPASEFCWQLALSNSVLNKQPIFDLPSFLITGAKLCFRVLFHQEWYCCQNIIKI